MFKKALPFFLYAETSVHAGSGSDVGIVDLPIQREKHTNYPVIHSSSLKGSLRASVSKPSSEAVILNRIKESFANGESVNFEDVKTNQIVNEVFGPETTGEDAHIGALSVTDAKILLFPVKSGKETFVWITCPFVLNRFLRDLKSTGCAENLNWEINEGTVSNKKILINEQQLVLEEFAYNSTTHSKTGEMAESLAKMVFPKDKAYEYFREKLGTNLAILPDDEFKAFVESATEVLARTKLDNETKIVQSGALWYEENLPAETVLYSIALATQPLQKLNLSSPEDVLTFARKVIPSTIQLGGNETIGKGILSLTFKEEK